MILSRLVLVAAAVAVMHVGPARAGELTVSGAGMSGSAAVAVPAQSLIGSPSADGETVDVFYYGRWRPYWRGYYHGSAGFSPRPNFYFGPVVYPRYYAFGPAYRPSYPVGYVATVPCSIDVAVASGPPTSAVLAPIAIVPGTRVASSEDGNGGLTNPKPVNGLLLPPQTIEPPLADDPQPQITIAPAINRGKVGPAMSPAGYAAYGESATPARHPTQLVKGNK
jgi:hypothetical protein